MSIVWACGLVLSFFYCFQGCALAVPSSSWCLTFALARLKNFSFFIQIICWEPYILQVESTKLPSILFRAQPWFSLWLQLVNKQQCPHCPLWSKMNASLKSVLKRVLWCISKGLHCSCKTFFFLHTSSLNPSIDQQQQQQQQHFIHISITGFVKLIDQQ